MSTPVRNPVRGAIYGALTSDVFFSWSSGSSLLGDPTPTGYAQSIYHDQAPADANYPFIVFGKSSGTVTETFGDYTHTNPVLPKDPRMPGVLQTDVWLVKGIVRGDDVLINQQLGQTESGSDRADRIAAEIKALLNDYTLSISGGVPTLYLRWEAPVEYAELADGVVYRHCGGMYRITTTNP